MRLHPGMMPMIVVGMLFMLVSKLKEPGFVRSKDFISLCCSSVLAIIVIAVLAGGPMVILFVIVDHDIQARDDCINGPPTYQGVVTDVDYELGGFGDQDDSTVLTFDNETVVLIPDIDQDISIGYYYDIWVYHGDIVRKERGDKNEDL